MTSKECKEKLAALAKRFKTVEFDYRQKLPKRDVYRIVVRAGKGGVAYIDRDVWRHRRGDLRLRRAIEEAFDNVRVRGGMDFSHVELDVS